MLAGGKKQREREGGKYIHHFTPAHRLLTGILYAGLWRERRKGKEESCPLVESEINSKILRAGTLDLACLKDPQQTFL
jgi:hypothetical protein